jgi:hypothetical protein
MRLLMAMVMVVQISLCGCSTALMLKQQQLQLLDAEYTNLQATDKLLTTSPDPETLGQASAFVSLSVINNVLSAADNTNGPIPSVPGATFHVGSVRASFPDGFPQLVIQNAWAQKGDLKLTLTVTAVLQPVMPSSNPSVMQFQVNVLKVVPVVSWSIFHLHLWGFAQDLIHAQLQDYANALPKFTVPLQSAFQFSNPAGTATIQSSTPAGSVTGALQYSSFTYQGTLQVDSVLFLSDGIHVYLSTH